MKHIPLTVLVLAGSLLASCSGSAKSSSSTTSTSSVSSPAASSASTPEPSAAAATPGVAIVTTAYSDIASLPSDEQQAIQNLGALGVIGATSGPFRPNDPVDRETFVAWLVQANNLLYKDEPGSQIRISTSGKPIFVDVRASDPNYKYVQSMANAGFEIGKNKTHFAPNQPLSRQELMVIEVPLDIGKTPDIEPMPGNMGEVGYSDWQQINEGYWKYLWADKDLYQRVYGATKVLRPKDPVTRGEAALALAQINGRKLDDLVHPKATASP